MRKKNPSTTPLPSLHYTWFEEGYERGKKNDAERQHWPKNVPSLCENDVL